MRERTPRNPEVSCSFSFVPLSPLCESEIEILGRARYRPELVSYFHFSYCARRRIRARAFIFWGRATCCDKSGRFAYLGRCCYCRERERVHECISVLSSEEDECKKGKSRNDVYLGAKHDSRPTPIYAHRPVHFSTPDPPSVHTYIYSVKQAQSLHVLHTYPYS